MAVIRARLRLFLVLILGLFVVVYQPLPFRLGGIVLAIGALVAGIGLLRRLNGFRRAGKRTPGALTLVVGVGLTAMLLLGLIMDAVYYPVVSKYEDCEAGANTEQAKELCQREVTNQLDQLLERLRNRTDTSP